MARPSSKRRAAADGAPAVPMGLVLAGALSAAALAAVWFGGQVKPVDPKPTPTAAPAPKPPPARPTPSGSAAAEVAGPRPTTLEACVAMRAVRELEAPSVVDKIAEIYARDAPKEPARVMLGALADAAAKIPDAAQRAAASVAVAEALVDSGAKPEAKKALDVARDAAAQAGITAKGGEGLATLGRIAGAYVAIGEPEAGEKLGGDAPEVLAAIGVALAAAGDAAKAKALLPKVAAGLEAAPQRLSNRIAMARLHAALGEAKEAMEVADGSGEAERALVHYRTAEVFIDGKRTREALASIGAARKALAASGASWQRRGALLVELAKGYRDLGEPKEADALIEEVLALTKDQEGSMYQGPILAQIATDLAQAGDFERAEKVIEPVAKSEVARTIAYPIAKIEILAGQGKFPDALSTLEKDMTSWTSLAYARIGASFAGAKDKDKDAKFADALRTSACSF